MTTNYPNLETKLYQARFSSGLLEVFLGAALAGMGALWLTELAGIAGIVPVVLISIWAPVHQRVVDPRAGYVRVTAAREARERKSLIGLSVLGVAFFGLGIGAFLAMEAGNGSVGFIDTIIAGAPAFLLAIGAASAGAWFGLRRLMGTAAALVLGGLSVVVFDLHPGWGMLAPGIAIGGLGILALSRFLSGTHPE